MNSERVPQLPVSPFTNPLLETIQSVLEDEQKAINALCEILDGVYHSGDIGCLKEVAEIMREWTECCPAVTADKLQSLQGKR